MQVKFWCENRLLIKMKLLRILIWGLSVLVLLAALTLALPVTGWRTGEMPLPPFAWQAAPHTMLPVRRIWIDTDAACGTSPKTDPDDCLAIAALSREPGVEIVGISTVFGNAERATVDSTVRRLRARILADTDNAVSIYPGAAAPIAQHEARETSATVALRHALAQGQLTIIALGPLTNIAAALEGRRDLRDNIGGLIAVMGRRPGHIFHPAEGVHAHSWLGHGPIFRDFNVEMDTDAVAQAVVFKLPLVLLPYDAGRRVEITGADLDQLEAAGGAGAWSARRARGWLGYWMRDMGRKGFFPFDLVAAGFAIDPAGFECAEVKAWVGDDPLQYFPALMPRALLVQPVDTSLPKGVVATAARYCRPKGIDIKRRLIETLTSADSIRNE